MRTDVGVRVTFPCSETEIVSIMSVSIVVALITLKDASIGIVVMIVYSRNIVWTMCVCVCACVCVRIRILNSPSVESQ